MLVTHYILENKKPWGNYGDVTYPKSELYFVHILELSATNVIRNIPNLINTFKMEEIVMSIVGRSLAWNDDQNSILLALLYRTAVQEKIMKSSFTKELLAYSTNHLTPWLYQSMI